MELLTEKQIEAGYRAFIAAVKKRDPDIFISTDEEIKDHSSGSSEIISKRGCYFDGRIDMTTCLRAAYMAMQKRG